MNTGTTTPPEEYESTYYALTLRFIAPNLKPIPVRDRDSETAYSDDRVLKRRQLVEAFLPFSLMPTYCASKAGVHAYTESLREQLAGTGVAVTELVPPAVSTAGQEKLNPAALPLDEYLDKAIALLTQDPTPREMWPTRLSGCGRQSVTAPTPSSCNAAPNYSPPCLAVESAGPVARPDSRRRTPQHTVYTGP